MSSEIGSRNLRAYSAVAIVAQYADETELQVAEQKIFNHVRDKFIGKRILDIGVGGGRTTSHLLEVSRNYVAIDYSPEMVKWCKRRYPGVDFRFCDVRDLSHFDECSFDMVVFSFNGIDSIDHSSRLSVLREIRRLLSETGAFIFSSHNRAALTRPAWSLYRLPLRTNPLKNPRSWMGQVLSYARGVRNAIVNRPYAKQTQEYELRSDEAFDYSLTNYYIFVKDQIRQLSDTGYRDCQAVGLDGRWLTGPDFDNAQDPWIYYLCWR
jgi:SAM-dependent methyltransferase